LAPLGKITVRGLAEPVEVFRLLSATARPPWEVRCAVYALNRFVGREAEVAQISAALGRAGAGRGQVVTILAEAGSGKSRLVHEFIHELPNRGWSVLRVAAMSHGAGAPYHLAAELLRSWLNVSGADDRAEVGRKLHRTLAVIDPQAKIDLAPLQSLLDLPVDDADWPGLAPSVRRHRTIAALRSYVLREAVLRPLVLVVEDYHWVDPPSAELLDAIVDGLGAARLLVLVTTRPHRRPHWSDHSYCLDLHLPALEPENAELLLHELIGDAAAFEALRQQILAQAGGIPLFIEEISRSLEESGITKPEQQHSAKRLTEVSIPASLQTIIAARIDRLPPARRRLLQVASVIGRDVPLRLLQAVADLPPEQLENELRELQRAEFLHELNLATGTEYTFRHALTQAVAYEEMLRKHRRELHARALEAMEGLFVDRLDELTERLADHALRGEAWDAAARYTLKAGDRAISRWAWREAIGFYDKAIDALTHVPESADKARRAIEARLRLRVAVPVVEDLPRMVRSLDEARTLARASNDAARLAEIDLHKCLGLTKMGLLDQAIEAGQQGYKAAQNLREPGLFVNASFALAQAYWYQGDFRKSQELLSDCLGDVRDKIGTASTGTTGTVSVLHLVCSSKTYAITGDFSKAFAAIDEARRLAEETRKPFDLSYVGVGKGFCLLQYDEPVAAVAELEEALHLARTGDIALLIPSSARYLGRAYALIGRLEEANDLLHEAIERTTAQGLLGVRLWSRAALALVQLRSSTSEARNTLLSTLELARQYSFRPLQAQLMRLIGNLHSRSDDRTSDSAEQWYRRAIQLSDELGMRPEAANARRDLALVMRRAGRGEEAALHQTSAIDLRRSMGMAPRTKNGKPARSRVAAS